MKIKKLIAILLMLTICITMCACGSEDNSSDSVDKESLQDTNNELKETEDVSSDTVGVHVESTGPSADDDLVIYDSGEAKLNIERFDEIVETVELTTENWRDYIKVYTYNYTAEKEDAFGEAVPVTYSGTLLGAGNEKIHYIDVTIELKDKSTSETQIYFLNSDGNKVPDDFNLDNYECTRIKGKIHYLDIPIEVISKEPDGSMHVWIAVSPTHQLASIPVSINPRTNAMSNGYGEFFGALRN